MEAPSLQLLVSKGPKKGETLECKPGILTQVGRVVRGNNFAVRDPGISQKHICFQFVPEASRWFVSDLDTSNGTLLNESSIPASVPVPITDNDVIKIGESTEFTVQIAAARDSKEEKESRVSVVAKGMRHNTRSRVLKDEEEGEKDDDASVSVAISNLEKGKGTRRKANARARSARVLIEEVEKGQDLSDLEKKEEAENGRGRGRGRERKTNARANSARVSNEESKEETLIPVSVIDLEMKEERAEKGTETGQRYETRANSARVSNEEQVKEEALGRRNNTRANSAQVRVLEEIQEEPRVSVAVSCLETEVPDEKRGGRVTRSTRRANSSRVLKELKGANNDSTIVSGFELKETGVKRKGRGKGNASNFTSSVEEGKNIENFTIESEKQEGELKEREVKEICVKRRGRGKGKGKASTVTCSVEEGNNGNENFTVESEKQKGEIKEEEVKDMDSLTLGEWFDRMEWFLPQVINDISKEFISDLKEKAKRFNEFIESGSDALLN